MLFYENIFDKIKEITNEYEETIGKRKKRINRKLSYNKLYKLKNIIYKILKDGSVLSSEKKILYESSNNNINKKYITMNSKFIGNQWSDDTREQCSILSPKQFITELIENGEQIYSELSNYNNKRDKCKKIVEILRDNLTLEDLEHEFSYNNTVVKKEINEKQYFPKDGEKILKSIECGINYRDCISIKINYDGYFGTTIRKTCKGMILYDLYKKEINEVFDEVIDKIENSESKTENIIDLIKEEFDYND